MTWIALYSGIVNGKSGKTYRFRTGDHIDAPEDEFRDVPALGWAGTAPKVHTGKETIIPNKMTVKQVKSYLDANGIPYKSSMRKSELISLCSNS